MIETKEEAEGRNKAEFNSLAKESVSKLLGACPLVEDEAIVWAGKRIEELEYRLQIPNSIKEKLSVKEFNESEAMELLKFSQHEACPGSVVVSRSNLALIYNLIMGLDK